METIDELRLKIAQARGMKWREWADGNGGIQRGLRPDGSFDYCAWDDNGKITLTVNMPHWTGLWEDAGVLLDEMYGGGIQLFKNDEDPAKWRCCMYLDGAGMIAEATGETGPEAVARCYLAWKENEARQIAETEKPGDKGGER